EDMKIEKIVLATEIKEQNKKVLKEIEDLFEGEGVEVEYVPHTELKAQTKDCKAVIRTGETTPYANIILQSGCIFA
ncbi:MAG: D-ribose pyranase, partial [Lachnospiraceae bacterium]|nr:D-ribose pyranase [Lachnospiraceae bacterium]